MSRREITRINIYKERYRKYVDKEEEIGRIGDR